jgi:hypothetical protein
MDNFAELLQQSVTNKIITFAQAHALLHDIKPTFTDLQKVIITLLHDLFCILNHQEGDYECYCIFRSEEERTECWDLPAHQRWTNVYHNIVDEHQPTDDNELLQHIVKASELLGNIHQTALFFVSCDFSGLPASYYLNKEQQEISDVANEVHLL